MSEEERVTSDKPLVSVLMITYKHEPYIAQAIEGVLMQKTDFPFELLIGEDCSPDQTLRIVREYERKHPQIIRVITAENNVGAHANVLRLEAAARGQYIACCEGDDYWIDPLKLQKQIGFLQSHPDHSLVHSDFLQQFADDLSRPTNRGSGFQVPTGSVYESLVRGNFISSCTVCWKAEVMRAFWNSPLAGSEYKIGDFPRWLFASRMGAVGYIDEPLAVYRVIPGSAMRGDPRSLVRLWQSVRQVGRDAASIYPCSPESLSNLEQTANGHILCMATYCQDYEAFDREYAWMLANNPAWLNLPKHRFLATLGRWRLGWIAETARRAVRALR